MIYHICNNNDWQTALKNGSYTAESLLKEGFIHCSDLNQITDTANLFFKGVEDLVILCIDESLLTSYMVYEEPSGGNHNLEVSKLFPHIYGSINLPSIVQIVDFPCSDNGCFELPELLNQ